MNFGDKAMTNRSPDFHRVTKKDQASQVCKCSDVENEKKKMTD